MATPNQSSIARRGEDQDAHAGDTHQCGGDERPPLRLIGPSRGEHGQRRPGGGEDEQHRTGDDVFWRPGEWSDNDHDGANEPADDRAGHDAADVTSGGRGVRADAISVGVRFGARPSIPG